MSLLLNSGRQWWYAILLDLLVRGKNKKTVTNVGLFFQDFIQDFIWNFQIRPPYIFLSKSHAMVKGYRSSANSINPILCKQTELFHLFLVILTKVWAFLYKLRPTWMWIFQKRPRIFFSCILHWTLFDPPKFQSFCPNKEKNNCDKI